MSTLVRVEVGVGVGLVCAERCFVTGPAAALEPAWGGLGLTSLSLSSSAILSSARLEVLILAGRSAAGVAGVRVVVLAAELWSAVLLGTRERVGGSAWLPRGAARRNWHSRLCLPGTATSAGSWSATAVADFLAMAAGWAEWSLWGRLKRGLMTRLRGLGWRPDSDPTSDEPELRAVQQTQPSRARRRR